MHNLIILMVLIIKSSLNNEEIKKLNIKSRNYSYPYTT